ncbi:MAG TPA: hypothetical protein VEI53_10645 [Ktedonobacteraceae bacterium]|nr:hypothetical protein [Ktedonobacteraceae bacterium]
MDRPVDAYVDYIVIDDEARAIITFTFMHMSEDTHVNLIHDRSSNGIEPYVINKGSPAVILSAQQDEGILVNVWYENKAIASGAYRVDTRNDDRILETICDYGIHFMQEGKLSSTANEEFEWVCKFAGD